MEFDYELACVDWSEIIWTRLIILHPLIGEQHLHNILLRNISKRRSSNKRLPTKHYSNNSIPHKRWPPQEERLARYTACSSKTAQGAQQRGLPPPKRPDSNPLGHPLSAAEQGWSAETRPATHRTQMILIQDITQIQWIFPKTQSQWKMFLWTLEPSACFNDMKWF